MLSVGISVLSDTDWAITIKEAAMIFMLQLLVSFFVLKLILHLSPSQGTLSPLGVVLNGHMY
jgi:hypothetical protein